jgi:hypothetical protein
MAKLIVSGVPKHPLQGGGRKTISLMSKRKSDDLSRAVKQEGPLSKKLKVYVFYSVAGPTAEVIICLIEGGPTGCL